MPSERRFSALRYENRARLALAGLLLPVLIAWAFVAFGIGHDYWYHDNEIAELSAGFALNIDHWIFGSIGKGRISTFNGYVLPGLPHQIASWLALRLSDGVRFNSPQALAVLTFAEPRCFFFYQQLIVLVLMCFGLLRLHLLSRPLGLTASLAVPASLLVFRPNWEFGVFFLDNPSMAPLLFVLFFTALLRTLGPDAEAGRKRSWIWLGFLGAMAYGLKMQYVAWLLAAFGGLGVAVLLKRQGFGRGFRNGGLMAAGAALGIELIAFLQDGKFTHREIVKTLTFHAKLLSGHETAQQQGDFVSVLLGAPGLFFTLVVILLGVFLLSMSRSDKWRETAPLAATVLLVFLAGLAAFLKFPNEKYLVSSAVFLPAGFYCWFRLRGGGGPVAVAAAVMALALGAGVSQTYLELARKDGEMRLKALREEIQALPLGEQEIRLWAYRTAVPEYNIWLALQWSGIQPYNQLVGEKLYPRDLEYNIWRHEVRRHGAWAKPADLPWRYAIFDDISSSENLPAAITGEPIDFAPRGAAAIVTRR